jgi:acetyltransferase-like isoleucine patch superfamily enzyme
MGKNVSLTKGSFITFHGIANIGNNSSLTAIGGQIIFGNNFSGGQDVIYNCDLGGKLEFGNDCLVGPRSIFRTSNHNFSSNKKLIRDQGHTSKNIYVGDDVWIGANSVILPGVHIGSHSVIGAGSIVTKNVPEFAIAVGNPAKVIKFRK